MIFETDNWIVRERTNRGLSQYKLAKILKVPNTKLCGWENGKVFLTEDDLSYVKKKLLEFDREFAKGKVTLKRQYRGRAEQIQPDCLQPADWMHISLTWPKSYLKEKSVSVSKKNGAPIAVSLFSGCGGMSLGFSWAGFNIAGFVEVKKSARDIYKLNFPNACELGQDILKLTYEEVLSWKSFFGEIDVLCGGPPCQGFSLSGKRDQGDYRNQLYREYQRITELIRPKVFVMENVRLLTSMRDRDGTLFLDKIVKGFSDVGYSVKWKVLNAANYGVPQSRERVIFIGVDASLGLEPSLPEPTHFDKAEESLFYKNPIKTFADACSDLECIESGEKSKKEDPLHWAIQHPKHVLEWLKITPEGKSAHENEDPKMRPPSGYNTTYKRLRWDEPSSTISTNFNMISGSRNVHPTCTRSLTIREAMRCQSFPDDFKIIGNWMDARIAIGNAVPPLFGEAIAQHILKVILKRRSD